ncbi:proton-coupled folate transporter-like [Ruditapes philippinarum]|uniref:proton-coupled folate transporter-like n=1 Tax=Ruditapes philippinarum TaxID=129788 RepID=UPI00295C0A91|nr:proton-coupled folate transporter-like [Ruditapes philippinarum]
MFDTIVGPYLLRAVCEKRFLNNITMCDSLEQLPVIENEVRKEAGIYFIIYRLFLNVPVICSGLFFGAWSDKRGRKIPMLVPCVGIILSAIIYICSLYTGSVAVWIALLGTLPQSIFGNTAVAAMSVNSYVATVSDRNHRTKYISLFDGISAVGQAFGAVLAGLLKWELVISFSVVAGIQCLTALSIAVFVQEIDSSMKNEYIEHIEPETGNSNCSKILNCIKTYTDLLKESGTNSFRSIVMAYLILTFIYGCDTNGVDDVFLMYVTARPFSWTKSCCTYLECFKKDEKLSITKIVTQSGECRRPETDVPEQNQCSNELSSTALKESELMPKHVQNGLCSGNSKIATYTHAPANLSQSPRYSLGGWGARLTAD